MSKFRIRFNRDHKSIIVIFIICILFSAVGYAALNTNLEINGITDMANSKWNIHFSNIVFKDGNVDATSPAKIENDTTIVMDVDLVNPGDTYSFDVDIINDGTIDAMLSKIDKTNLSEEQQKYLEYSIKYADGNDLKLNDHLKNKTSNTINVTIKYKDDAELVSEDEHLSLKLTLDYVQDDD